MASKALFTVRELTSVEEGLVAKERLARWDGSLTSMVCCGRICSPIRLGLSFQVIGEFTFYLWLEKLFQLAGIKDTGYCQDRKGSGLLLSADTVLARIYSGLPVNWLAGPWQALSFEWNNGASDAFLRLSHRQEDGDLPELFTFTGWLTAVLSANGIATASYFDDGITSIFSV